MNRDKRDEGYNTPTERTISFTLNSVIGLRGFIENREEGEIILPKSIEGD